MDFTKRIEVFRATKRSWDEDEPLVGLIDGLQAAADQVPLAFRGDTKVSWSTEYDGGEISFEIYYVRPKTDEELTAEKSQQRAMKKAREEVERKNDLHLLAELKRKYEGQA